MIWFLSVVCIQKKIKHHVLDARAVMILQYMSIPRRKTFSFRNSLWSCRSIGVLFIGENPMAGIPICCKKESKVITYLIYCHCSQVLRSTSVDSWRFESIKIDRGKIDRNCNFVGLLHYHFSALFGIIF